MTTNSNNSLSGDQVLATNFLQSKCPIEYFDDKYYFSEKNWKSYHSIQNKYPGFFDKNQFGLDLGRLARNRSSRRLALRKISFLKSGKTFKIIHLINRLIKMQKSAYFLTKK